MTYFKQFSAEVLAYYKLNSTLDVSRNQFQQTLFLKDYASGKIEQDEAVGVLDQLDYYTRKKLYHHVMAGLNMLDPGEKMLELLDLLDPEDTFFEEQEDFGDGDGDVLVIKQPCPVK
jgi:hypothetical protein